MRPPQRHTRPRRHTPLRTAHLAFALFAALLACFWFASATPLGAQTHEEPSSAAAESHEAPAGGEEHAAGEEHGLLDEIFHWTNFLILLGAIIYGVRKMLIPFLNERARLIREDMQRSAEAIEQANLRLKAMEERLGNLDRELTGLREAGLNEARGEHVRIEKEAETEALKILSTAESEIDSAVKAACQQLQSYAAELALGVAEKKIKESLTPQSEKRILNSFAERLASATDSSDGRKN